jgi:hypothetical protein
MLTNVELLTKHRLAFKHTFKRDLAAFMNPILGFDVVKFDDYLRVPDGVSMNGFILVNFGENARNMVKELLKME